MKTDEKPLRICEYGEDWDVTIEFDGNYPGPSRIVQVSTGTPLAQHDRRWHAVAMAAMMEFSDHLDDYRAGREFKQAFVRRRSP